MKNIKLLYIDLFCWAGGTSTGVEMARIGGKQCAKVIACVNHDRNAIASHAANLKIKEVFSKNQYSSYNVIDFALSKDNSTLWVVCKIDEGFAIKSYFLTEITLHDNKFVHNSLGSFFGEDGALKRFTLAQGLEWTGGDTFDDFC